MISQKFCGPTSIYNLQYIIILTVESSIGTCHWFLIWNGWSGDNKSDFQELTSVMLSTYQIQVLVHVLKVQWFDHIHLCFRFHCCTLCIIWGMEAGLHLFNNSIETMNRYQKTSKIEPQRYRPQFDDQSHVPGTRRSALQSIAFRIADQATDSKFRDETQGTEI